HKGREVLNEVGGRPDGGRTGPTRRSVHTLRPEASAIQLHYVLGGRALLALHHVKLYTLALGERLEATALNCRMMHEAILLAVLGRDEAEALGIVKPLHRAGHAHCSTPECSCGRSPLVTHVPTTGIFRGSQPPRRAAVQSASAAATPALKKRTHRESEGPCLPEERTRAVGAYVATQIILAPGVPVNRLKQLEQTKFHDPHTLGSQPVTAGVPITSPRSLLALFRPNSCRGWCQTLQRISFPASTTVSPDFSPLP